MDILRGCAEILFRKIPYDIANVSVTMEVFCQYSHMIFPHYTDDEIEYIHEYYIMDKPFGVFDIILEIAQKVLTINMNKVECNYFEALRWRDISFKLGQDIFITALLAKKNCSNNIKTDEFLWPSIIEISNDELNNRLRKGMAENHFHLNGSSRIFPLSFICVMNNIIDRQKHFNKLKCHLENTYDSNVNECTKKSLYHQSIIAAAIRLYLYCKLENTTWIISNSEIDFDKLDELDASKVGELQRLINLCKDVHGYSQNENYFNLYLDYAFTGNEKNSMNSCNEALVGERKFLYNCFYKLFNDEFNVMESNYLYQYLIIKNTFRSEIVQTNGRIGFKNFYQYQDRKEVFIKGYAQYEQEFVRLAINSTLKEGEIVSLEARISPKDDSLKNIIELQRIDKIVDPNDKPQYKHFYVFHFPKGSDDQYAAHFIPRHKKIRDAAMKRARAIVAMIEKDNRIRQRIRGIDACSNEIGCRPEVFAHSMRYLMNTHIKSDESIFQHEKPQQLNATYHVGEDFLDIVDGLRAIDEAITYFGFKKGNRLGHAIALGLNADNYYKKKRMQLIMTEQDALDNIAWLLNKAANYNIKLDFDLYDELYKKYMWLFNDIYGKDEISIECYFQAWKLRGDDPGSYFIINDTFNFLESQNYLLNESIDNEIRRNPMYQEIYRRYHYDVDVKQKGHKKFVFELAENYRGAYIDLVKSIQYEMQKYIKSLGIMIESNPSSNYLIGNIEKYEDHPIFTFYDINSRKESNICVSINTDDQGVFETSLQNEYALLSLSLEKSKKYKKEKILSFIDNIRCSGLEQVFK